MRVIATSKTPKIEPFRIPDDHLKVGKAWEDLIEDFKDEITYFGMREVSDKVRALRIYGGQELKKLARNLPDPPPTEADDEHKEIKQSFSTQEEQALCKIYV